MVQQHGVDLFLGFPGQEILYDGDRVAGVRIGDKGIDKQGQPKPNFQPGIDLKAKVTIFAEGARGSLAKTLIARLHLDEGKNPQTYSTGVKEIWKVRPEKSKKGLVIHTLGYPLSSRTFGGGFIYHYGENLVSIGFVTGLSYSCSHIDPHKVFQKYKKHPAIASMLEGGTMLHYGAKTIPEGGYFSMPRCWGNGFMIIGDNASFLNSQRLKGIHMAIKSGMLAAETAFEALQTNDFSAKTLGRFEEKIEQGWIKKELWKVRNFHQAFDHGLWYGLFDVVIQMVTNGRGIIARRTCKADDQQYRKLTKKSDKLIPTAVLAFQGDDKLTFTKTTDVFHSGTQHEENQPCHLVVADTNICHTRCREEYGNPCQHFCPANVYEMVEDPKLGLRLAINAANCVHCKTCDIKDPYGIITWVPPEGGGGPSYLEM
jgi:electron-transferring-flavoprotein dehydrogenase